MPRVRRHPGYRFYAGPFGALPDGATRAGGGGRDQGRASNGDQMRNRMIPSPHMDHDMASAFLALNHGKRSVVLDMKTDEGRAAAREMVKKADVVVQNFRGGVAERLGLGWEDVAINPRAIYCQITGYGTGGPKGKRPYDGPFNGTRMMSTNGHPETGPTRTGYFPWICSAE